MVTITQIQVADSNGDPASGWTLVTGDAESTDSNNESLTFTTALSGPSGPVLNVLPNSPTSTMGNACPDSNGNGGGDLTGLGTQTVRCSAGVRTHKTGTLMLGAKESAIQSTLKVTLIARGSPGDVPRSAFAVMRRPRCSLNKGAAISRLPRRRCRFLRRRRSEAGDTLIEVLLALVVLGLASVALLLAFATSISGSGEHRSLTTVDTLLKSFVESATSQIEKQPYQPCATVSTYTQGASGFQAVIVFALPAGDAALGYSVGIDPTPITYWNGTSFGASCTAGSTNPQEITATAKGPYGTTNSLQFVVDDPLAPPPPVYGSAAQLAFNPAAPGPATAGVSIPNLFVQVEDTTPQTVTSDWSFATLAIKSGPAGATLSSNCTGLRPLASSSSLTAPSTRPEHTLSSPPTQRPT